MDDFWKADIMHDIIPPQKRFGRCFGSDLEGLRLYISGPGWGLGTANCQKMVLINLINVNFIFEPA